MVRVLGKQQRFYIFQVEHINDLEHIQCEGWQQGEEPGIIVCGANMASYIILNWNSEY